MIFSMHPRLFILVITSVLFLSIPPSWGNLQEASILGGSSPQTIAVLIQKDVPWLMLEGLLNRVQGRQVELNGIHRLQWRPSGWQFLKQGRVVLTVSDPELFLQGTFAKSPSRLRIFQDQGRLSVVAKLNIEDYIVGVVGSEMPRHWPKESMKAQAVAARSYAFSRIRENQGRRYHVVSTIMDQVYRFGAQKDLRVRKAVGETKGQHLLLNGQSHRPFKAHFHSNCGGSTTHPIQVWGYGKSGGTVKRCPSKKIFPWTAHLPRKKVARRFGGDVERIEVESIGARIQKVRAVLHDGERVEVTGNEFRQRFGFSKVKSTRFKIEQDPSGWQIIGQGFGHGVGLCQWGAKRMAEQGEDYRGILRFYYPQAQVTGFSKRFALSDVDQYTGSEDQDN